MMEIFKVKYVLGVILFIVYGNTWAGAPAPAHVDHKQVDLCTANDQILVDVHRSLRSVFNNAYLSMLEGMGDSFIARDDMADFSEFTGLKGKSILQADAVWKDLYNTIGFANAVILKLAPTISEDNIKAKQYIAEAKFVRALCYFHLVRLWGRVPLRTDENSHFKDVPRTDEKDVYTFIVEDLVSAVSVLPADEGKVTKWSAKALLVDVYFTLGKYDEVCHLSEAIVESGRFELIPVSNHLDFENVFGALVSGSPEELFYVHYDEKIPGIIYVM